MPSNSINNDELCNSWIFYATDDASVIKIRREIDKIFSDYSFYPEIEWGRYGYRAPEGHQVMGAWRHPQTKAFAFLLDNPKMYSIKPNKQLLLYIAGDEIELLKVKRKCDSLKNRVAVIEDKVEKMSEITTRLEEIRRSKSFGIIMATLSVFTAVINAFSLYLRKLPPPQMSSEYQSIAYGYLIVSVHFGALALLIIVICFLALFLVKYGQLVIRRL